MEDSCGLPRWTWSWIAQQRRRLHVQEQPGERLPAQDRGGTRSSDRAVDGLADDFPRVNQADGEAHAARRATSCGGRSDPRHEGGGASRQMRVGGPAVCAISLRIPRP